METNAPYGSNGQQPPMPPYPNPEMSYQGSNTPYQVPPQSHLVWAILATICCSPIFGAVAIYFSSQVNSKFRMGDVAGAQASARKAKTWSIVAAVVGVISGVIGFFAGFMGALG